MIDQKYLHSGRSMDSELIELRPTDAAKPSEEFEERPLVEHAAVTLSASDSKDENLPLAVAEVEAPEAEFVASATFDAHLSAYSRPEFIYCRFTKKSNTSRMGLFFRSRRVRDASGKFWVHETYISRIGKSGLFGDLSGHCIRPGDLVVSVNNMNVRGKSSHEVATLIRESVGYISITVRNRGGDPRTVASSVQKPNANARVGLSLKNNTSGLILKICRIDPTSPFAESLLVPGHRCMFINDKSCTNMPAIEAASKIRHTDDMVTIISCQATSGEQYASVLCEESIDHGKPSIFRRVAVKVTATVRSFPRL